MHNIQVYASTADKDDDEVESFYEEIKSILKFTKPHDINIVMGDFIAKIGCSLVANLIGKFDLDVRNERDDRLLQFFQEHSLKITNT